MVARREGSAQSLGRSATRMSVGVEHTHFALSRLPLGADASDTTLEIASPRDLGHRIRRLAEGRCCEVGRAHPPLVTIEDYDDAPQRKGLTPGPLRSLHSRVDKHLCIDLRCLRPPTVEQLGARSGAEGVDSFPCGGETRGGHSAVTKRKWLVVVALILAALATAALVPYSTDAVDYVGVTSIR